MDKTYNIEFSENELDSILDAIGICKNNGWKNADWGKVKMKIIKMLYE